MTREQPDLLDLLAGRPQQWAEEDDHRAGWRRRRATCPDGRVVPANHDWCGRCGTIGWTGHISTSHDLGYCGCPNDVDPTWSRFEKAPGFQSVWDDGKIRSMLTDRELSEDRWDRQFFADCECGCACGLHGLDGLCIGCYRCRHYRSQHLHDGGVLPYSAEHDDHL